MKQLGQFKKIFSQSFPVIIQLKKELSNISISHSSQSGIVSEIIRSVGAKK
jgi:hypothetical protein